MIIFTSRTTLREHLQQKRLANKTIGLVPTMGALHNGHLSLLEQARAYADEVVCTIFVNPTQFTDAADLEKYPRPVESDIRLLTEAGCDVLFMPPVDEMYSAGESWHLEIGPLENLLEGEYRPGHYQGVTQVVYKLFDLIKPDYAFFGQKDYQQYLVIGKMVELMNVPVKLVMCPIIREAGGLAMSSRNVHLSADEREDALLLSKTLMMVKEQADLNSVEDLREMAIDALDSHNDIELDYFEIADAATLLPATDDTPNKIALVAAKVGNTRLIDNVMLG